MNERKLFLIQNFTLLIATAHEKVHVGNQKFKCDTCGKAFDILRQLTEHAAVHRVDKPFTCSICNKHYSRGTVLSQHMKSHTSTNTITNTTPVNYGNNAIVNTIQNVQANQMALMAKTTVTVPIMTQQPLYKCQHEQCDKILMTPTDLKEHELVHIAVQKDDKKLITVKEVMVMVKTDEPQIIQLMPSSQIKCYACNELFNTEQERNEHAIIHNNRLLTNDTNQTLSSVQVSNTQLLNPIQTATIIDQPPEVPSLSFPDVEPMYEEIQTGPKFMDLDSTRCVKIIKPDDEIIRNSDTNEKFKCEVCNKRFSILSNYNFHLRVHKRDKPHRCLICGKSFRLPKSLEQHMVLHSETSSYHCVVCNRIFSRSGALKMHMRSHTTAEIQAPNRTYVDVMCHDADDDLFANEDEENNVSLDFSHLDVPICDICGIKFNVCGNTRTHTCPKYNANEDDEFDDDDEENLTAMDIWNCDGTLIT